MKGLKSRILSGVILAVLVVIGLSIYADVQELVLRISSFQLWVLFPALALAFGNYMLRFFRWNLYLSEVGIRRVPFRESFGIFWAGLVMSITPGKVGELLKSVYLRDRHDIPVASSAPVVVGERLTDFIAVLLLCVAGGLSSEYGIHTLVVAGSLSLMVVVGLSMEPLIAPLLRLATRIPFLSRWAPALEEAYGRLRLLIRPKPLCIGIGLGVAAWWLECVALYVILTGFPGLEPVLGHCVFVYAFATLAGAVTMLPGGLVFTEGSMIALMTVVAPFALTSDTATATAATVLIRFSTLWFAIALGLVAMVWLQRTSAPSASTFHEGGSSIGGPDPGVV